jgi:DNA relaxase NicK
VNKRLPVHMSFFDTRPSQTGGILLEENDWITQLKEKRLSYGISQNRLAVTAGISREYLSKIESGRKEPTEEVKTSLMEALERLNPDNPLEMMFDYVRIRFPTQDVRHVIQDILHLKMEYMLHEDYGFYSYSEHYAYGDIFILTSPEEEKGTLLELKGKGCRQFENFLLAQHRSWFDFLMDALVDGGVMKRLDLAINDMAGILDIPELTEKCRREECVSVFRSFKSYRSGELVKSHEEDKLGMGSTLYIGSLKSEVYFCLYEKNYEQYVKYGIPIEETPIKNRFEIRLKNERAYYAVKDLLTHYDAEQTAFSIINRYVRFVDKEVEKRRSEWRMNEKWAHFLGDGRGRLKLTTKPEPYTLQRTLNWIARQVAPTWKTIQKIDAANKSTYLLDILEHAKLTEKHRTIIKQQTASVEEVITT